MNRRTEAGRWIAWSLFAHLLLIFTVAWVFMKKAALERDGTLPRDLSLSWNHDRSERAASQGLPATAPASAPKSRPAPEPAGQTGDAGDEIRIESAHPISAPDSMALYAAEVRSRILSALRYPIALQRRRVTGEVRLKISLGAGGDLLSSRVTQGSGFSELDELALEAVKDAAPYPPPSEAVVLDVPIRFAGAY